MSSDHPDDEIITNPNQTQSTTQDEARDLMLKARLLNSGEIFNQEAFSILTKAITLDPNLLDARIELTSCYQKKLDIDGAMLCLEDALKYCDKPNKIILRKLSACLRQKNCDTPEAKIANLLKSLELSKQALKVDLHDEENYYNLAKAYLCLFFATECVDQQLINLSKAAFLKALTISQETHAKRLIRNKNQDTDGNLENGYRVEEKSNRIHVPFIEQSDFLFNFSTVLVYLQEFQKAIEYLRLAINLDKDWHEPRELEESLVDYIKQIHLMINDFLRNSKKVTKKYSKIVESLKNVDKIEYIILLDQQRLYRSTKIRVRSVDLNYLNNEGNSEINSSYPGNPSNGTNNKDNNHSAILNPKNQEEKDLINLLHLKLVGTINYNQSMYLTFIAIDHNYSYIVLTIYNLAASRCPRSKDVITIVDPKIEEIKVDKLINVTSPKECKMISYKRISVRKFKSLYVNGFRITTNQVSKPQFKVSILP